ncbi:MAG TPA: YbaK/EbsC family protein [Candidatus Saccharimonadales bacterium]|nr:YbaK/EbsC family protein [Candidatus Saccharimonadales bacterium]
MQTKLFGLLKQLEIPYRSVDHPAVFTVAESLEHLRDEVPVKNLLLVEKGEERKVLVILPGNDRLDARRVAEVIGSRKLQFASEATLKAALGVTPGSVSLFSLLHEGSGGVEVVIDERLLAEPEVGFHPSNNTSTIFIPGSAVPRIVQATGHRLYTLAS